ncbi:MAG: AIR synthase related protein [Candidatus Bathyarchaeia archaeon]
MMGSLPPIKVIKTARDVSIFEFGNGLVMVVGCDSAGGIGPKPLDKVKVDGHTLGRFTARVALMEVLAAGALPICLVSTLSVEPEPTGVKILEGIRSEVQHAGLDHTLVITGSMEKNIRVNQTGLGVTVIGLASKKQLKIGKSKSGDLIIAVGIPSVGIEVLAAEKQGRIADLKDLLRLKSLNFVHEVIPVGSKGIIHEANVIAQDSHLRVKLKEKPGVNLKKPAGPGTVVMVTISKDAFNKLPQLISKPIHVIGILH